LLKTLAPVKQHNLNLVANAINSCDGLLGACSPRKASFMRFLCIALAFIHHHQHLRYLVMLAVDVECYIQIS